MRGYISFVLVFVASGILLSSFSLVAPAYPSDLSKAVLVERAYGLQMNIKEAAIESIRQGTQTGFAEYDRVHDLESCLYCPGACGYGAPCNPLTCSKCFREDEARAAAVLGAQARLLRLQSHQSDPTFAATTTPPVVEVFLQADPLGKNGFSLSHSRLRTPMKISVSSEELSGDSKLPAGLVIE